MNRELEPVESFDEGRDPVRLHPLAPSTVPDFDWQGLELALGELRPEDRVAAADALRHLVVFITEPLADCLRPGARLSPRRAEATVGRTALLLGWLLSPETFGGLTLEGLAEALSINERHLRKLLANVRSRFGIIRRIQ